VITQYCFIWWRYTWTISVDDRRKLAAELWTFVHKTRPVQKWPFRDWCTVHAVYRAATAYPIQETRTLVMRYFTFGLGEMRRRQHVTTGYNLLYRTMQRWCLRTFQRRICFVASKNGYAAKQEFAGNGNLLLLALAIYNTRCCCNWTRLQWCIETLYSLAVEQYVTA